MANTSYLKKVVEPYLLDWASRQIGVPLKPAKVVVGQDSEGRDVRFAFDGVSEDGTIGVCVSASSSYKVGQARKYFMEATLLNRCSQFKRRIMVFTNPICWEGFRNAYDGLVDLKDIEPMICKNLPREMKAEIQRIYEISAKEVGDKSGPGTRIPKRRGQ